jgi:hypothetical protein
MTRTFKRPQPNRAFDLTGERFGRWVVISRAENVNARATWNCRCDCATERVMSAEVLMRGRSHSCGCLRKDTFLKHGMCRTPTYEAWCAMHARCRPTWKDAHLYHGRGIAVCRRWGDFRNFLADMGERPPGRRISIDRRDNDKGYEPGNCRWATPAQQSRNTRQNRFVFLNGERITLYDAIAAIGIKPATYERRKRLGWSAAIALMAPVAHARSHGGQLQ